MNKSVPKNQTVRSNKSNNNVTKFEVSLDGKLGEAEPQVKIIAGNSNTQRLIKPKPVRKPTLQPKFSETKRITEGDIVEIESSQLFKSSSRDLTSSRPDLKQKRHQSGDLAMQLRGASQANKAKKQELNKSESERTDGA